MASSAPLASLCALFLCRLACPVHGSAFLGQLPEAAAAQRVGPELEKALLAEIEEVMGADHRKATEGRLHRMQALAAATYTALPKNEHGRLGHAAARYALHRLFVQRHAWFVKGLEPGGGAWNTSSPTVILQDRLPEFVQGLFERRAGGLGFDLHEFAVLAATLENLVHHETLQRLEHTYRALERSKEDPLSLEESHDVIDSYMISYVLGLNFSAMSPTALSDARKNVDQVYPTWPDTQLFLREVQGGTAQRDELTFENVAGVVEDVGERYGRWQDKECRDLKNELLAIEDRGTGRVRLADFYGSAVHDGKWQFSESVDYLRQMGALDESDPQNLRVIISNYINSPTNCVASSSYYSVCCLDECESLLGHLEEKLGVHEATAGEIAALVVDLPSATVSGSRTLSASLLLRLEEVAQHHGGKVPLHGRLFAQWMHHAYPRECPYPHVTGTTRPKRVEEFMAETGQEASASEEEMRQHCGPSPPRRHTEASVDAEVAEDYSMWTMEEELVFKHQARTSQAIPVTSVRGALRGVVFVAAVVSATLVLLKAFGTALVGATDDGAQKHQAKYCV